MDASMQNMLDMYLYESNSLIEQLDGLLLESEQAGSFSEDDINTIFRIMHTLKGSSAMMQFDSLMTAAHRIEDLFFFIRENGMNSEHTTDLFNMLFAASDFMKAEIEKIENEEPLTQDTSVITDKIEHVLKLISGQNGGEAEGGEASEEGSEEDDNIIPESHPFGVKIFFDEGLGMENLRAFMIVNSIQEIIEDFFFYPPDIEENNATSAYIIDQGFVLGFKSDDDRSKGIGVVKNSVNIREFEQFEYVKAEPEEKTAEEAGGDQPAEAAAPAEEPKQEEPKAEEKPKEEKPAAAPAADAKKAGGAGGGGGGSKKQSLISVNLSKLDNLMNIVSEIVITESMVTSNPDVVELKSESFNSAARQLRKLTDDLQETAMSIRMVPVSSTFQKMTRIVRDMSQKLNKKAQLVTIGADTEVDKTIVDSIGDPIMHMVRNSMDHGIEEDVNDRLKRGKPAVGTVTLSAQHTGSEVVITIADDGQGVSSEGVLNKAKRNGLLTKPESEYSRREILNMLLLPGFSTNEEVTEYSGRGVGMDVVRKNIEQVGGVVNITSEEGEGMTTTFKIPLTLAIVAGMQIGVGNLTFTIPISNIRQSFKVKEEDIVYDEARGEMIQRADGFYPIVRLYEYFEIDTEITNVQDGIMMWVESNERSFCLFVDRLKGEQQIVVKPLPAYLNDFDVKSNGITGCTIMGDGDISIILDPQNLYDSAVSAAF